MPPTLKRILRAGLPAAVLLAAVGYGLAELAGMVLAAQAPVREVDRMGGAAPAPPAADPLPPGLRTSLPLTMALWGFGLVAGYELLRRLVKGPPPPPKPATAPPAPADVDKLLSDLLKKAEADRPPADASTATPDRP